MHRVKSSERLPVQTSLMQRRFISSHVLYFHTSFPFNNTFLKISFLTLLSIIKKASGNVNI